MGYEFYVTIRGKKQGVFHGRTVRGDRNERIPASGFSSEVDAPHDAATGQASGKRQYKPITITKEWDAASPQILQAIATNELLESILVEFPRINAEGEEEIYYTIRLTNGGIAAVRQYLAKDAQGNQTTRELEDVSFTFHKIDVEHVPSGTKASDTLGTP